MRLTVIVHNPHLQRAPANTGQSPVQRFECHVFDGSLVSIFEGSGVVVRLQAQIKQSQGLSTRKNQHFQDRAHKFEYSHLHSQMRTPW
jgi:hypothetical protein